MSCAQLLINTHCIIVCVAMRKSVVWLPEDPAGLALNSLDLVCTGIGGHLEFNDSRYTLLVAWLFVRVSVR
jgi:hypothetical protein